MKKRIIAVIMVLTMLCGLIGCSQSKESDEISENTANDTMIFVDDCGREVEVPSKVTKIVASGPVSQLILYPLAADELVGLSYEWGEQAEEYIDQKYYDLPFFGQLYGSADLSVEELAKVGPEVIIDIGEPKKSIVEDMDNITEQTTVAAIHIDASLATMGDAYRKLGELLGKEERAEELADMCEEVYQRTASIMEEVGESKVDALYISGEKGDSVLAKGSFHGEVIDMLTNNIAVLEDISPKGAGNPVDMEQIAMWNPECIIFAPNGYYEEAAADETWGQLTAISTGNYLEIPNEPHNWVGNPTSVQRLLALTLMTASLYPEYCDYDVKEEIQEMYQVFYGYELTDEKYNELTANSFPKSR